MQDPLSMGEDVPEYSSSNTKKARLQSMLSALLDDPVLTLISLELGSAMRVTVVKMDNTSFGVAVLNSATVKDLKQAIEKKTNEMEQARMGHRQISWRHVWANFCLSYHNNKLLDDKTPCFRILAYVIIRRCILFRTSCHENPTSTPGGRNTVSFMA
ncbi:hypothetical protein QJS10_CPA01g00316 [Acorus calamus]|uniref:SNRNP25 ubiquitin-like domain-containing protein n=1 Tax=Acorus calamus TaxID=4465 RepID=A0AAV9FKK1_ACOCL|nr:hypothetical protein QJS10_CPA01g00316 [Acorus calamus]